MAFSIYWMATVTIQCMLVYKAVNTSNMTKLENNATEGCLGNQSLSRCRMQDTRNTIKSFRKQMYSTSVGFTYPKGMDSYEEDMGYKPNVGFEPYWPPTTTIHTTRRDYKVCGVVCPKMYISYGPICGRNKKHQYKNFLSYCDMRNEDCRNLQEWRAAYKGVCYASIRTYPTKSSDIKNRIKMYVRQYMARTPTTPAIGDGVQNPGIQRRKGSDVNRPHRNKKDHNDSRQYDTAWRSSRQNQNSSGQNNRDKNGPSQKRKRQNEPSRYNLSKKEPSDYGSDQGRRYRQRDQEENTRIHNESDPRGKAGSSTLAKEALA